MSLTPFTGGVTAAALNANFDDKTETITTQSALVGGDFCVFHRVEGLDASTALAIRTLTFYAPDDFEVRVLRIRCVDTGTGATATATLSGAVSVDDVIGQDLSVSVAGIGGTSQASLDCRDTDQPRRVMLVRGVPYTLTLEVDAAVTEAQATVVLRARRRVR